MRRLPPISLALITMALTTACGSPARFTPGAPPIKVGVLHSRTGTMSLSENTVAEAELLAIEQINRRGGIVVNGQHRRLVAIEEDGASEPKTFATKAAQLIDRDQVAVVFGGWTSSSRKAMAPVFEQRNTLLFYPVQFEGLECSRNIVYGGSTPNQQAEPAIEWLLSNKTLVISSWALIMSTREAPINRFAHSFRAAPRSLVSTMCVSETAISSQFST